MGKADQTDIRMRIVIERPVVGVLHSLQAKDGGPLDPQRSLAGEPLVFDFVVRMSRARNSSATRFAAKGPCAASFMSASARPQAIPLRRGAGG